MDAGSEVNSWVAAPNRNLGFQLPMLLHTSLSAECCPVSTNSNSLLGYRTAKQALPEANCGKISKNGDLLSKREKEILKLAAAGYSNKEIAQRCCLSQATVKTHFQNIFGKIEVNNRTAAVMQATAEGLLEIDWKDNRGRNNL